MVLRLHRRGSEPRQIDLGYGVTVSCKPFGYADYREAEAAALRLARQNLPEELQLEAEIHDEENLGPEHDEALRGLAARYVVKLLLLRFGAGWAGVELEDGSAAPMTAATLDEFMRLFPGVSATLHGELLAPWIALEMEGNVSAPSPNTATAEG
ncbi:hypothetical protein [Salipiger mangrovisoli]|uniref:Uncharacterized protein n=1 Tax=Salipiger mangrovisoli TaxID=2865933 RepID=A0ABR9WWY7_9RHOB|nr:hypothetical protein [Salipiger mangrovisoli]MBE9635780.1 hypothetical protein [Salipiger mangrovisoli]